MGLPSASITAPAIRDCTYACSKPFLTSLAVLGRLAARSAFHCATEARYSSMTPRVAALRRNSREILRLIHPKAVIAVKIGKVSVLDGIALTSG